MDALHLAIALGPLAVYLLAIGAVNFSRRPLVTSGVRDSCALAIGIAGLVLIGPIYLSMPLDAAAIFGAFVWALLLTLYVLLVTFVVLMERPRLVIYNATPEIVRAALGRAAATLDPEARWAGDSLALPRQQVELRLEAAAHLRNVSLVANHDRQQPGGWKQLETALARELAAVEMPRNGYGLNLIVIALAMTGMILWRLARDPDRVAQTLIEMLAL